MSTSAISLISNSFLLASFEDQNKITINQETFSLEFLSNGSFKKCYSCKETKTNRLAIICIFQNQFDDQKTDPGLLNEIHVIHFLKSIKDSYKFFSLPEHIFIQTLDINKKIGFFYEYFSKQNLFNRIHTKPELSKDSIRLIQLQIFSVIEFLQTHKTAHKDIKPENFLYRNDENPQVKLIDFDATTSIQNPTDDTQKTALDFSGMTPEFISPKLFTFFRSWKRSSLDLENQKLLDYLLKNDVFAMLLLFYELQEKNSLIYQHLAKLFKKAITHTYHNSETNIKKILITIKQFSNEGLSRELITQIVNLKYFKTVLPRCKKQLSSKKLIEDFTKQIDTENFLLHLIEEINHTELSASDFMGQIKSYLDNY